MSICFSPSKWPISNKEFSFPPVPDHAEMVENMLAVYRSLVTESTNIYMSVPLTTGINYLNWIKSGADSLPKEEYDRQHKSVVFYPNKNHAEKMASQFAVEGSVNVINPAAFDVVGWGQNDYRYFWGEVVVKYASVVVLLDGWQYSSGCSYEFLRAIQTEVPTYNEQKELITPEQGYVMLAAALEDLSVCNKSNDFHREVIARVQSFMEDHHG